MVLYTSDANSLQAGRVQLHCAVQNVPITMIHAYRLAKTEPHCGYSVWKLVSDSPILSETGQIVETVVYSELSDGSVAVLLPIEYR